MSFITFSEGSGLNDSIYGKCQAPIRMFLEKRGEQFEQQSVLKDLFLMGTSDNFGDTFTSMTAFRGFEPVGENGAHPADGNREGYKKRLEYETWKDSFSISKEMIEDAKMMDMRRQPAGFITGFHRTREDFAAAIYGGALAQKKTITYGTDNASKVFDVASADNTTLFAKNHKGLVSGKTQSNVFKDAFSADALAAMETAMQDFRGENDELLDVAPDTILIPNDWTLKKAVFAAIGADKDPLTSNNAFNYVFGRWNVIVWPYLNKYVPMGTAPWILLDSRYNETYGGAIWNDRVNLEVSSAIDRNTDANVWYGRARFNATFYDWRFAAAGGIASGDTLISD